MKRKNLSLVLLLSMSPSLVMANNNLAESIESIKSASVPDHIVKEIEQLSKRNIVLTTRPTFCPLNSTRNDVILSSVKNIEAIFKDDCLDKMQGTLDQVLTGADDIQTSINNMRVNSGKEEVDSSSTVADTLAPVTNVTGDLNGAQMASLVNGLDTLFNKNKCTYLDDTSFLENSANIIQNFSQFGLYSPSPTGVTVAYGGLVVGSILKFINNLFEGRFDFEKDEDRMTFIKLNCSFYDVRIKMQQAGIIDISTDQNYKDLARANELIAILSKISSDVDKDSKTISLELEKIKKLQLEQIKSDEIKFFNSLSSKLVKIESRPGFPIQAQRDALLDLLTGSYSELAVALDSYITPVEGQRLSRQNRSLSEMISSLDEVKNYEEVEKLEKMSDSQLNTFVSNLQFHIDRVMGDISKKKDEMTKDIEKMKITIDEMTLSYSEISKVATTGNGKNVNSEVRALIDQLTEIKIRLESITGKKEFSSENGNDGADLKILEANDKIVNYIYGDYGKDFIEHMRKKSKKVNDLFMKDFSKFADKYLDVVDGVYRIKDRSTLSEDQIDKVCVSAKTLRGTWKYGQKWAEMGYDFLSTNKDIFGESGSYLNNDRDKIFNNSQGAVLARRIISAMKLVKKSAIENKTEEILVSWNGKKHSIDKAIDILKDDYKYTLGKSMLDIHKSRDYNGLLQNLYGKYRCDLRANYEK
ncbi:hypothetical protein [Halobacteriovorax sp. HLS]|uniref:hypothetical protein n=1 Tax=Halobacteriovorax sp. HLS TaxID=2234000 RepID=UPI000FDB5491|nr:hypothetical protein [Halobacteriovorax sp. HLS]